MLTSGGGTHHQPIFVYTIVLHLGIQKRVEWVNSLINICFLVMRLSLLD